MADKFTPEYLRKMAACTVFATPEAGLPEIRAALLAYADLRERTTWRTMESAKHEPDWIQLWLPRSQRQVIGHWWYGKGMNEDGSYGGCWVYSGSTFGECRREQPTHWKPCDTPPPPSQEDQ